MKWLAAAVLAVGCADDDEPGDGGGEAGGTGGAIQEECEGTRFFVDPAAGDDSNDGSEGAPWQSIQFVIDTYVDCTDEGGTPMHDSAPIQGGDCIMLVGRDGHDQDLEITGCYNEETVWVQGLVAREPTIRSVHFRGSAYWRIDSLSFVNDGGGNMVDIDNHDSRGDAHHIEIVNNYMTSGDLQTIQDYTERGSDGVRFAGPSDIVLRDNEIIRVAQAITAAGDRIQVLNNKIDFFSADAIATGGHGNRFIGNHISNAVKLGDGHHDDFLQFHMGSNPDTSSDIEIAYNVFVQTYPDELPPDMRGPTQCIGAFGDESMRSNFRVYNNLCKTDHFHGITIDGLSNSVVINNTVVGGTDMPGLPPGSEEWPSHTWISVGGDTNVVRNNLVTLNQSGGDANIEITGDAVYSYFTDWDVLDLSLAEGSPAIDAGNADEAPADDIRGNGRDGSPDVGAYEYGG